MGFWDAPATILNPTTGLPINGNVTLTPDLLKIPAFRIVGRFSATEGAGEVIGYSEGAGGYQTRKIARLTGPIGEAVVTPTYGPSSGRPSGAADGTLYWDTTLNMPIFRKAAASSGWVDAMGVVAM
ncbi:hypothetical protein SEA_SCOUPSA_26 [Microbacterium phage SCoupsA]|nr:hypothetical protein SEA_BADULIA_26 [Microbacterium phage Badulia]WGH20706.1 hypothetical protein SEA_SCOUPSA_26 [Microbacterium phage SCoupsA]